MTSSVAKVDQRLKYFQGRRPLRLLSPAPRLAIAEAELRLHCAFSPEHREFLETHNGGRIVEIHLLGVQLLGAKRISSDLDTISINLSNREHEWWPKNWLQVGSDGFGDYLIADLSRPDAYSNEYPILIAYHEHIGASDMVVEFASGYFHMLDKLIGEMIRLYTPEGRLKSI